MNLMDLIIKITVDQSGVDQGMDQAKKTVTGASDTMTARAVAVGTAMYDMGKKATTGLLNIGKFSMDVGMAFDTSMASVAAISGATGGELDALTEKAKEMGAQTKFSASESADAFTYMAMAGWKTGDMLDGIEGIMNLAAASGENLASVSDIVTDAITAFGLSAEDSGHFADVLAAASNSANTNVSMLGGSFKYVAPVAGALGYSIEDVSVALGLMANSGIKAEQAGTAMRSMLTRLAKPTKEVYSAFETLGISAEDALTNADGSMKPLSETIGILREKMSGLSETEQASAAASIAGQEAMSGLLAIVNASNQDFEKLTSSIANADGTAQGMADTMNDNLPGAITILKSAMEGLGIAIYENGSEALKSFVEKITEVVTKITEFVGNGGIEKLINGFKNLLPWISGATTAIVTFKTASAISSVFEILTKAVDGQALSWAKLSAAMNTNPFVLIVTIILTLVSAFVTLILTNEEFRDKIVAVWNVVKDTISGVVAALKTFFTETIPNAVRTAFEWLKGIPEKMGEIGKDMVRGLWEGIKSMGTWLIEKFSNFVDSIVESVKGALGIHSPSRVFAGIGENMARGLGEGWESEYGAIRRGITDGLGFGTASVDFGASGVAAIGNSIASGVGALASSGSGSIVINLTTELDGAVLARKMVPYNAAEALRSGV